MCAPALLLALVAPAFGQDLEKRKNWPVMFQSAHYEVRATAPREAAKKLADHMDLVFETYTKLFALRQAPQKKAVLVLFKDEAEYTSQADTPKGSGAYYDPNIKYLVGFHEEKRMYNVFAHEGTHQFTDLALKNMDKADPWFVEGMAECIGNSVVQKGRLFMCARNGVIAQENLPVIQQMIREKKHASLKDLVAMGQSRWEKLDGNYPQAWSFCTFLLAYPKYEETKSQIPNGKYWTVLANYIKLMADGKMDSGAAFRASFQLNGKPLDFDVLEKEWADYILKMENSGTLAEKEFEIGSGKAEVSPDLSIALNYPAKQKGDNAPLDRARAPYPLLIFTSDAEGAPYKVCDWMAHELATFGFVTAVLPGKGGSPEDAPRLLAAREWILKRNAGPDAAWKGAVNPAMVIVVGHGPGAAAALAAGADATKVAGVLLLAPPAPIKPPDKYKGATLILSGDDGQDVAGKIYGDLKKPRYLYSIGGMDKAFMPEEKGAKAFQILLTWLSYRYAGRDEWKSFVAGDDAKKELQRGEWKQWKVEE
ncbi:MAG TPA: hypothetical protein VNM14_16080 [Planctomycetota bacterium]|nr:hypothetical protein [Planctomycetota bacterium]